MEMLGWVLGDMCYPAEAVVEARARHANGGQPIEADAPGHHIPKHGLLINWMLADQDVSPSSKQLLTVVSGIAKRLVFAVLRASEIVPDLALTLIT